MSKIGVLSACTLFVAAGAANAAITGTQWVEVPNAVWAPTGMSPGADPFPGAAAAWASQSWRTYDLFLLGNSGDLVNGVNIGGAAADPYQINLGGATVFNHLGGSDQRSMALEPVFSSIGFDTYATYGGNDTTAGHPFGGFAGTVNLSGAGDVIRFTSFAAAGNPAAVGADGRLRVLRLTIANQSSTTGTGSLEVGLPGGALAVFNLGPVPTPGAAALLGLAGLAGIRRRR